MQAIHYNTALSVDYFKVSYVYEAYTYPDYITSGSRKTQMTRFRPSNWNLSPFTCLIFLQNVLIIELSADETSHFPLLICSSDPGTISVMKSFTTVLSLHHDH